MNKYRKLKVYFFLKNIISSKKCQKLLKKIMYQIIKQIFWLIKKL